jgi:negative regulator of genetic competence, sporulation and motility
MTQMKEMLTVQEINDGKHQANRYDLNQEPRDEEEEQKQDHEKSQKCAAGFLRFRTADGRG